MLSVTGINQIRECYWSQGGGIFDTWLLKNPYRQHDYLVILTEPRMKSPDLRQTVQNLLSDFSFDIQNCLIIINADRWWLKESGLEDKIQVYSDEKMEWRWVKKQYSMTIIIIANKRVQKPAQEVDMYEASRVIKNAVKWPNEARV